MTKTQVKFILFTIWSIIVGLAIYIYFNKGLSITVVTEELRGIIRQSGVWGPVLYVIIYSDHATDISAV
jgi:uncharacterized membrane protein YdjX (TVP38/TMEM64 family)